MFLIYYLKIWTLYFGKMQVFAAQTYFEFVAEHDDAPIGSIGLMTIDWPPHPEHPKSSCHGVL